MSFTENPQKDMYVVADDSSCTKNYDKHWKTYTYVVDNTRNNQCDLLNYPYKVRTLRVRTSRTFELSI